MIVTHTAQSHAINDKRNDGNGRKIQTSILACLGEKSPSPSPCPLPSICTRADGQTYRIKRPQPSLISSSLHPSGGAHGLSIQYSSLQPSSILPPRARHPPPSHWFPSSSASSSSLARAPPRRGCSYSSLVSIACPFC